MKKHPPITEPGNFQSYNFYPAILESIAEGIVVIGIDKKILYINRMAKALIGLSDEVPEGMTCAEVINTDLCSKNCPLDSSESNSSCTGNAYFMNINLHKKDASMVPLCLNVAPLNDENGNIVGIIENFRPMSEAVRVIESLEKSNILLSQEKNKISSIVDSLADGVFTVDKDLRITSFNKGMEILTGQKESDVIGRSCSEILHADNCASDCPFSFTMKNGYGRANVMERIEGKDGNVFPVLISTAFLKDGTQDMGLIATVRDASELENLKKEINDRYKFSNIIGKSDAVQQVFELIETLGYTDCAVLIEGESGTGKELVARAIHHESDRRNKPFVKVNCSAIVEGLFESELFGHVKGAFTGAIKDKTGKFEQADGGTLFLDEIGEMPVSLQSKLLRVLQDREFEKVGDTRTIRVDVRIIAATNRNLKSEISANNFREDLYYRLCVVPVQMPPLRERQEDIPLLVGHFLEKFSFKNPGRPAIAEVTKTALAALMDYDWPGNIRELENAIEHACIRTKTNIIDIDSLPLSVTAAVEKKTEAEKFPFGNEETEKHHIQMLLRKYNGSKAKVARDLGLSRTTLWRRFKKHNISVN